ncbi:MAG: hypothetical protein ACT4NU_05255 [Chromatiales bacterium]
MSAKESKLHAENYVRRRAKLVDWDVAITTYKIGDQYHCVIDNVSPGATIARTEAGTLEQAESEAIVIAEERLSDTRTLPV